MIHRGRRRSRLRRTRTAAVLAAVALVAAGCGGGDLTTADGPEHASGDSGSSEVDTPELRQLKADAGIEDCPATGRRGEIEGGLPGVVLECLGGGAPVSLPGLAAKPTVVNVWASWCGPCREELPHFARLHAEAGDAVSVLGIAYRDPAPDKALTLAESTGVTYPLVADPDETVGQSLGVIGLPQTVLVGADGRIVETLRSPVTSYDQLRSLVEDHLDVDLEGGSG